MSDRDPATAAAQRALEAGIAGSVLLLSTGLALALIREGALPPSLPSVEALPGAALSGRSEGYLGLGLIALLATPALRVLALAWAFGRRSEWAMLGISCSVLAVLGLSIALGSG